MNNKSMSNMAANPNMSMSNTANMPMGTMGKMGTMANMPMSNMAAKPNMPMATMKMPMSAMPMAYPNPSAGYMPMSCMPMQQMSMPMNMPMSMPMPMNAPAAPAMEESYVENILRLNRGKIGTFYMTYENNSQWNAKIFQGVVEAAGRDHIVISDPESGMRYLLLMINLDYVTFDEPIAYEYPFHGGVVTPQTPV